MKFAYLSTLLVFAWLLVTNCTNKKTNATLSTDSTQSTTAVKLPLPDSIEQVVNRYDSRLDVKMRRKTYEPRPGSLVTLQKWFEFGDTTQLVKLREETITGDTKMEVIQFHYINQKLAEVHDYVYDKKCNGGRKQCMSESKFFFKNGVFDSAVRRETTSPSDSIPVIERSAFQPFTPEKTLLENQQKRMEQISKKYASLPYKTLSKPS
jgi:hypothetical protein